MKTTMKSSKVWMAAAAMVFGVGCMDAPDQLGASPQALTGSTLTVATGVSAHLGGRAVAGTVKSQVSVPVAGTSIEGCAAQGNATALVQTATVAGVPAPASPGWRYYIDETPILYVAAYVKNLCGGHLGRFDFYSPDGRLFKRVPLPFVADTNGANVRKAGNGYIVETSLVIAGTEIAGEQMTGVWSVNFAVDGTDRALGLGLFELYR